MCDNPNSIDPKDLNILQLDPPDRIVLKIADERDAIQKKTFTKWVNKHLKKEGKKIDQIYEDLREGENLLSLLEVLSKTKLIKLVNIRSEDIVDGNPKLTLGLIWTIILHFQISDIIANGAHQDANSAREALLSWVQINLKPYNRIKVKDFTESWKDGLAFNYILHRFRPECVNLKKVLRLTPRERLKLAFDTAKKEFAVTKLLDPEDVDIEKPDERSLITYVSSFYDAMPEKPAFPTSQLENEMTMKLSDYESRVTSFMAWIQESQQFCTEYEIKLDRHGIQDAFSEFEMFDKNQKVPREREKSELYATFEDLQEFGATFYDKSKWDHVFDNASNPVDIENAWDRLMTNMSKKHENLLYLNDNLEGLNRICADLNGDYELCVDISTKLRSTTAPEVREALTRDAHCLMGKISKSVHYLKDKRVAGHKIWEKKCQNLSKQLEIAIRSQSPHDRKIDIAVIEDHAPQDAEIEGQISSLETLVKQCRTWIENKMLEIETFGKEIDIVELEDVLKLFKKDEESILAFDERLNHLATLQKKIQSSKSSSLPMKLSIVQEWFQDVSDQYKQLKETYAKTKANLTVLQSFINDSMDLLSWFNQKIDIEIRRDWASLRFDMDATQQYHKQLCCQLNEKKGELDTVLNSGIELSSKNYSATQIQCLVNSLQIQWMWLNQLVNCFDVHYENKQKYNEINTRLLDIEKAIYDILNALKNGTSASKPNGGELNGENSQPSPSFAHHEIRSCQNALSNGHGHHTQYASYSATSVQSNGNCGSLNGIQSRTDVLDYIEKLKKYGEELDAYADQLIDLKTQSSRLPSITARKYKTKEPRKVDALCDYKSNKDLIVGGDSYWLVDNQNVTYWKVVDTNTNKEHSCPSVCFVVQPPAEDLERCIENLLAVIKKSRESWSICYRRIQYEAIMKTIETINEWDRHNEGENGVADMTPKAKGELMLKFKSLMRDFLTAENDGPLMSEEDIYNLQEEVSKSSLLHLVLSPDAEELPIDESEIKQQISKLKLTLDEFDETLSARHKLPLFLHHDDLENMVLIHKEYEENLQMVEPELDGIKAKVKALPAFMQTPVLTTHLDETFKLWDCLWVKSHLYVEKLKCIEILSNNLEETNHILSKAEISLANLESSAPYTGGTTTTAKASIGGGNKRYVSKAEHNELNSLRAYMDTHEGLVSHVTYHVGILEKLYDDSQDYQSTHPLDAVRKSVQLVTTKWNTLRTLINDKSKNMVEQAYQQIINLNKEKPEVRFEAIQSTSQCQATIQDLKAYDDKLKAAISSHYSTFNDLMPDQTDNAGSEAKFTALERDFKTSADTYDKLDALCDVLRAYETCQNDLRHREQLLQDCSIEAHKPLASRDLRSLTSIQTKLQNLVNEKSLKSELTQLKDTLTKAGLPLDHQLRADVSESLHINEILNERALQELKMIEETKNNVEQYKRHVVEFKDFIQKTKTVHQGLIPDAFNRLDEKQQKSSIEKALSLVKEGKIRLENMGESAIAIEPLLQPSAKKSLDLDCNNAAQQLQEINEKVESAKNKYDSLTTSKKDYKALMLDFDGWLNTVQTKINNIASCPIKNFAYASENLKKLKGLEEEITMKKFDLTKLTDLQAKFQATSPEDNLTGLQGRYNDTVASHKALKENLGFTVTLCNKYGTAKDEVITSLTEKQGINADLLAPPTIKAVFSSLAQHGICSATSMLESDLDLLKTLKKDVRRNERLDNMKYLGRELIDKCPAMVDLLNDDEKSITETVKNLEKSCDGKLLLGESLVVQMRDLDELTKEMESHLNKGEKRLGDIMSKTKDPTILNMQTRDESFNEELTSDIEKINGDLKQAERLMSKSRPVIGSIAAKFAKLSSAKDRVDAPNLYESKLNNILAPYQERCNRSLLQLDSCREITRGLEEMAFVLKEKTGEISQNLENLRTDIDSATLLNGHLPGVIGEQVAELKIMNKKIEEIGNSIDNLDKFARDANLSNEAHTKNVRRLSKIKDRLKDVVEKRVKNYGEANDLLEKIENSSDNLMRELEAGLACPVLNIENEDDKSSASSYIDQAKVLDKHYQELKDFKRKTFEPLSDSVLTLTKSCRGKNPFSLDKIFDLLYEDLDDVRGDQQRQQVESRIEPKIMALNARNDALSERIANREAHLAAQIQDNLEAEFLHNKIAPKLAKLSQELDHCLTREDNSSGEITLNPELLYAGCSPTGYNDDGPAEKGIVKLHALTKNLDDMMFRIASMEPAIKELDRDVTQLRKLSKPSTSDTLDPLFEEIEAIKVNRADALAHMNQSKKLVDKLSSYYNPICTWRESAEKACDDPSSNAPHLQELMRSGTELQQTSLPKLLDTGYALMALLPASQTCPDLLKTLLAEVREGMETTGDRLGEAFEKSTQNQHNFKDLQAKLDKISNWLEAVAGPKLEIYRYQLSPLLEPLQNQHRKLESLKIALGEKGDELDVLKRVSQDLPLHSAESEDCVERLKDAQSHLEQLRETCSSLCDTVGQELLPKAQNFHEIRKGLNVFLSTMENNMDARELGSVNINDQLEKLMSWTLAVQGEGAILGEMDDYLTMFPAATHKGSGKEGEIFQLLESLVRQDRSRYETLKNAIETRREKLLGASQLVLSVEGQIDIMSDWMKDADLYLASDDPSASYKPDPNATKFGSLQAKGANVDPCISDPGAAQVTSILYLLDPDLLKSRLDNLKLLAADIQAQKVKLRSINMEALRAHREVAAYLTPNTIIPGSKDTKASNSDGGVFEDEELMGEDDFPSLRLPAKVEGLKRLTNNVAQSCDQKVGACRQLVPLLESFTSEYDAFVAWLDEAEHDTRNYGTLLADQGSSAGLEPKDFNVDALRNSLESAERGVIEHRDALKELNERAYAIIKVSVAFVEGQPGSKKRGQGVDENPIEKHLLELTQDLDKRYHCLADCLAQDKANLQTNFSSTQPLGDGDESRNNMLPILNRADLPNTLEGVLMSVARTADQLAKTEPISCYPDKIRAQIAENQHFAQDMEGRAATYDAIKMAAETFIRSGQIGGVRVADDVAEQEKREIGGKLEKLNQLWEAVVSTTHTRRKALEDTYEISSKFWEALFALFSALKEIQDNVGYYETPSIAPQNIQEQRNDLLALKEELECVVGPEVEQCRQTGQDLLELIEENAQERPDVEKGMEELENAYETTRHAIVEREECLGEAMDRSMLLHELLTAFLDWLDRAEQELAEADAGGSLKNSLAAARSTDSLRSSCGDLLNNTHSSRKGRELKRLHEQADCLRALRTRFNAKTIELERINALGNEIIAGRAGPAVYNHEPEPDASVLTHNLHEANERWECVMEALSDRQQALETSLLELGQLRGAVEELCAWFDQTEATLGCEASETTRSLLNGGSPNASGEKRLNALSDLSLIKSIEHRVAKHKMLRNEVASRKSTVDSLNHAVSRLQTASMAISSVSLLASNTETDELAGAVANINERWRTLLGAVDAHTQRLENELKRARSFVSELQDATAWLNEIDSQHLLTAKPLAGLPETTREQMDQFELVHSELESGKPVIEELLARGEGEREEDGVEDVPLDRQLDILKHKWENIRVRAQDRKTKLEIAHKQAKEFQDCFELCGRKLGELEAVLNRDCDQNLPRRLEGIKLRVQEHANSFVDLAEAYKSEHGIRLEKCGTHLKYFCQKQDAIVIKNQLIQAQHRWEKVVARGAERRRALEKALAEAQEFYDAQDHLTLRLTDLQHELGGIFSTRDGDAKELNGASCVDKSDNDTTIEPSSTYLKSKERLKQLKEFRQALSTLQPEYEWVLQKGKDLKDKCNVHQPEGQADANGLQSMLNELKQKWNALIVESSNHQKVLEGDLILCGQIHEALQELKEWLSAVHDKLVEESKEGSLGDIDTIMALIERHQIFQKELDSRTANIDSLKAAVSKFVKDEGEHSEHKDQQQQPNSRMMENVKQPLQDLVSLWTEVCSLSRTKDGKLAGAKEKAEKFHGSVRILADWMEALDPRVRDIDKAGDALLTSTTSDCGARTLATRLQLCKAIKSEIGERKVIYDQTLEMGREIVADAYVTALKPMENWMGFLKEMWEDLNGGVEHLHHRLEREYEDAKLNAKLLEELLAWLTTAEATITAADQRVLPRDIETIEQYLLEHKEFMDNMSNKQQDVQKLTSNNSLVPLSLPQPKFKRSKFQAHKKSQSDLTAEAQVLQSQNEPKNPKIRNLLQKWRCVWLLAIDRQGKLVDYLNYLKEVERLKDFQFEEWRKRYMSWMNHNKSRVMDFFRSQDKDGDGRIPVQDFIEGILATRFQTSRPEMEHVAAVFDANSDGLIDYKEYVAALRAPAKGDGQHPMTDVEKVKDEVQRLANLCQCDTKYNVDHVGKGSYRFGKSLKLHLVRILRSTVMVRVGGGWVALEEFLVKNDPCRAQGRTNIELRQSSILAPGVSQAMAPFKSKSPGSTPQTPASFLSSLGLSNSSTGPITKIREKTLRSTPWRINSSTSHTPERRKTPSTPSTPPYHDSTYYDSATASRIPRKSSDGTGSRASSKSGSKAPSRIGSRPQSPAPAQASLPIRSHTPTTHVVSSGYGQLTPTPKHQSPGTSEVFENGAKTTPSTANSIKGKGVKTQNTPSSSSKKRFNSSSTPSSK